MLTSRVLSNAVVVAALWAAAASSVSAQEGRLSLADRVARLEQQQNNTAQSANVDMLNRVTQLQSEVQILRGMLEEQDFKLRELERRNRDLAVDFDSRLERLEGGASAAASNPSFMDQEPALNSSTGGTVGGVVGSVMEEPEVRSPMNDNSVSVGGNGSLQSEPARVADPAAERSAYDSAFEALKNGQYAEAARRFQAFLGDYPNGEFAPNAHYWLGESYYVTQNYQIALESFERLLSEFPSSNKAPDALLKVGYCHYELRNWTQAEDMLNRVISTYPDTTVSRLAQGRLRALRLENRQ